MNLISAVAGDLPAPYALARGAAWLGAAATLVTVPVLVYVRTGSALASAAATAVESVPYLLFGLRAGSVVDRGDPAAVLGRSAALGAFTLLATAGAAALLPRDVGTVVFVAGTAIVSALATYGDAAGFALVPLLVPRRRLPQANGRLSTLGLLLQAGGVGIASGLLALGAGTVVLVMHAGLLMVTAGTARQLRRPVAHHGLAGSVGVRGGLRFIARHPIVGPLTGAVALHSLTTGAVGGLLAVFADQALGWGQRPSLTALLYASLMLGGLLASVATPRLLPRLSPGGFAVPSAATSLVLLVVLAGFHVGGVAAVVVLIAWQTAASMVVLAGITIRQIVTPQRLQGRVGVTGRMIAWGTQPLGALAGGVIASASDARTAMLALGAGTAASVALLIAVSRRDTELRRPVAPHLEEAAA